MDSGLVESVKRVGFRKWYERELLSSHAHMVLAFLSAIGLVASVEVHHTTESTAQGLLFVLVCAGIGLWALRRYIFLMMRAEGTANQASCPECGEYGRFRIVRERPRERELGVRCRKCDREWAISIPE
jgi:hypothetical protein